MKLLKLNAAPAIDKYDWEVLSCFDRTLATIAYTLHGQAFWHFVLNKYSLSEGLRRRIDVKIGDERYYDMVCAKSGINLSFNRLCRSDAQGLILNTLDDEAYPIVVINDKLRPRSKHYRIKDHGFFVLIYGYDEESDEFLTYDLPLEKEFWRMENSADGIIYEWQRLKRDVLFSFCDSEYLPSIGGLEKNAVVHTGNDVAVFVVKDSGVCDNNSATSLLKEELNYIIRDHESHVKYASKLLNGFIDSFDERYSKYLNINLSEIKMIEEHDTEGIKHLLFYPYEWKLVCWHESHIKMLTKTLPFLGVDMPDCINKLFRRHGILKVELVRDIIRHDKEALKIATEKALVLIDDAIECYEEIVCKL